MQTIKDVAKDNVAEDNEFAKKNNDLCICKLAEPKDGEDSKAPKVLESVQCMSAADGSTVEFVCKVEGSPRPQITWFRYVFTKYIFFTLSGTILDRALCAVEMNFWGTFQASTKCNNKDSV